MSRAPILAIIIAIGLPVFIYYSHDPETIKNIGLIVFEVLLSGLIKSWLN